MYLCEYVCMYVCVCMNVCLWAYVCMHACMHVCICMYVCMHACVYASMYVKRLTLIYCNTKIVASAWPQDGESLYDHINDSIKYDRHGSHLLGKTLLDEHIQAQQYGGDTMINSICVNDKMFR